MAESQLSHLPVIGGMKEGGRVEFVLHKYNKVHDRKECVLEDLRTYVEDYF
jgi:hypothetical protein